jgi:hypothetical protein
MDPYAPVNGISLERYAELAADVSDTQDADKQAEIVAKKGVSRQDWEAAKAGWTARMADMSLMGAVATRFMPLYQAELAKKSPAPSVSFEDYVAMSGAAAVLGYEGMLAHYKVTPAQWTQIGGSWNAKIPASPQYMQYGTLVQNESARIRAGGAPKAVTLGAPGAPAPQQPQAWGQPQAPQQAQPYPYAQQPYAQQPYAAAHPFGTPHQQQQFDRQLDQGFNELGSALASFGNAVGGAIDQTLGTFTPGTRVFVLWSDGNRYPGTVMMCQGGQVQIAFPDGRQIWAPANVVTLG